MSEYMNLEITDTMIKIGEGIFPLSELRHYKIMPKGNGMDSVILYYEKGGHSSFEVDVDFNFTDMEGKPLENPEHYLISWLSGNGTPQCTVKQSGKYSAATFEIGKPANKIVSGSESFPKDSVSLPNENVSVGIQYPWEQDYTDVGGNDDPE